MLTLVCGRSRAGKTTYSRNLINVVHLDNFPFKSGYQDINDFVSNCSKNDITIDGVYDTADKRISLLNSYTRTDDKICIWLDTPLDIIESRFRTLKPYDLPHSFDPPTYEEGWTDIIRICNSVEEHILK